MTDHQNSVRIVSEEIDVRLLVKNVEISCQACVKHSESYVQKYKLIS